MGHTLCFTRSLSRRRGKCHVFSSSSLDNTGPRAWPGRPTLDTAVPREEEGFPFLVLQHASLSISGGPAYVCTGGKLGRGTEDASRKTGRNSRAGGHGGCSVVVGPVCDINHLFPWPARRANDSATSNEVQKEAPVSLRNSPGPPDAPK